MYFIVSTVNLEKSHRLDYFIVKHKNGNCFNFPKTKNLGFCMRNHRFRDLPFQDHCMIVF